MTLKEKFKKFVNWFEDLFMANHSCIVCSREIPDGTKFQICEDCISKIHRISGQLCGKCGDEILEDNKICDHCKDSSYGFDQNRSYCFYDEESSKIVKGLKYARRKYYAKYVAEMLADIKGYFDDVDMICFVPINKKRRNERGFNQAEEIAIELSKLVGKEVANLLAKDENSKHQAGLSQKERMLNLVGSFSVIDSEKEKIKGKTLLIIDDVFTTGTTLSECSKALKKLKPKKIKTLTFAKTRFGK